MTKTVNFRTILQSSHNDFFFLAVSMTQITTTMVFRKIKRHVKKKKKKKKKNEKPPQDF